MTRKEESIERLCEQLRCMAEKADKGETDTYEYVNWGNLSWRVNRGAPDYGVYENYPITPDFPINIDETGAGMIWSEIRGFPKIDIAISHKGNICHAIFIDAYFDYSRIHNRVDQIRRLSSSCDIWICSSSEILGVNHMHVETFPGIRI